MRTRQTLGQAGPRVSLKLAGYPALHIFQRPRNRVPAELNRLRKLAFGHPAVDRRSAEPHAVLHFPETDEPRHPLGFGWIYRI